LLADIIRKSDGSLPLDQQELKNSIAENLQIGEQFTGKTWGDLAEVAKVVFVSCSDESLRSPVNTDSLRRLGIIGYREDKSSLGSILANKILEYSAKSKDLANVGLPPEELINFRNLVEELLVKTTQLPRVSRVPRQFTTHAIGTHTANDPVLVQAVAAKNSAETTLNAVTNYCKSTVGHVANVSMSMDSIKEAIINTCKLFEELFPAFYSNLASSSGPIQGLKRDPNLSEKIKLVRESVVIFSNCFEVLDRHRDKLPNSSVIDDLADNILNFSRNLDYCYLDFPSDLRRTLRSLKEAYPNISLKFRHNTLVDSFRRGSSGLPPGPSGLTSTTSTRTPTNLQAGAAATSTTIVSTATSPPTELIAAGSTATPPSVPATSTVIINPGSTATTPSGVSGQSTVPNDPAPTAATPPTVDDVDVTLRPAVQDVANRPV
ncbi:MAG TPA: hypothetical protein VFV28_04020, partial [Limnobacter sp.]|nr:hypothetical protein [Limnobacter sp.]